MPHHPSSSAAPAVHDTNTNRNKSLSKIKKKITKKTPIMQFSFPPYKARPDEKIIIDEKRFRPNVDLSKTVVIPGPFPDVFDAKNPPKQTRSLHFEKDPSLFRRLTKCATLAIGDYNSQTKSDYRFVDIQMATSQLVAGAFYNITFQAMNSATKKCETFEATVFIDKWVREVQQVRMKGSDDDWYNGTLSELAN